MKNLKKDFIELMIKKNISLEGVKLRYLVKSRWQKNRYKDEYITPELWIYKEGTQGFLVDYEGFYNNPNFRNEIIEDMKNEW